MRAAERLLERRVPLGWIFGGALLYWASPRPATIAAGLPLLAAGCALRTWASGHIRKREELAATGPYAHTRNPLYLGSFLMACGALVMAWNPGLAAVALPLAALLYAEIIRREERYLDARFGERFRAYSREVPRFLPRLRVPAGSLRGFEWRLVWSHREWRAWLGAAALVAAMAVRGRLVP